MQLRITITTLAIGLLSVSNVMSQIVGSNSSTSNGSSSWRGKNEKTTECSRGHKAYMDQLARDLDHVIERYKNEPRVKQEQIQAIVRELEILQSKRIICGCMLGKLKDLPSTDGIGGSATEIAGVRGTLKRDFNISLSDEQIRIYLDKKLFAARNMPQSYHRKLEEKFGRPIDLSRPEAFPDDVFMELQRMIHHDYYVFAGKLLPIDKRVLEETGYYFRGGKKILAPKLKVVKVVAAEGTSKTRPLPPPLRNLPTQHVNGGYLYPDNPAALPELWPVLFNNADALFAQRKVLE